MRGRNLLSTPSGVLDRIVVLEPTYPLCNIQLLEQVAYPYRHTLTL